ncbi:MAG: hypothetical protein PHP30_02165 [Bacteroidales bacterium]|nr:hypothetical protein [Bacteroidales bacterium]MDD2425437.1 hypothetical protein [Bacteroidales bacterium]MDD3988892.1 hypothetical protein [Bacteroidales bacterium]
MQNKLQELTDKLYNEGLSKGKREAEEIVARAEKEASGIISKAREESRAILDNAAKEVEEVRERVMNEVKMASRQSMTALKKEIENILVLKALSTPVKESLEDPGLIKSAVKCIIESFNPENGVAKDLNIVLPEKLKNSLDNFIVSEIGKELRSGITLSFDKKLSNGFKIGPKGENYYISFTDKDFQEFLSGYLRPKTREIIFSE